jgi:cytidine deaminase
MSMLPEQRDTLLRTARSAAANAQAKHSGFRVGAAVLDDQGRIHPGCNVESDSYGLTICAERAAIFGAVAAGARHMLAVAVSCPDAYVRRAHFSSPLHDADAAVTNALMPCGACRQVMAEHLTPGARVLVDEVGEFSLEELLPAAFRLPDRETE